MLSQHLLLLASLTLFALSANANLFWPRRHHNSEKSLDERHSAQLIPNNFYDLILGPSAFASHRFSTLTKLDDSKGWIFQLDVPGLSLDEISVHAEGQVLLIRGEHKCGKRAEPTCIERHVSEEIRLSESCDLETAEADLDQGVLRVHIRPKSNTPTRSRAVKIIDRARGTARSWGETLKNTFTWQHDPTIDSVKHSAAEYGSEVEETVNDYIKQIQQKLQIPLEKQREFSNRIHGKSQDVYRQLKEKTLTPSEAYNRLYDNAEGILNQIKQTAEDLRQRSEHVADEAWDRARNLKDKAERGAESVARGAWETAGNVKDEAQRRAEHASQYAKRQSEAAEEVVSQAAQSAKSAAYDAKDTVERKAGEAYESAVDMKNSAEQKIYNIVEEGKETAKTVGNEASEKAGQVADKVGEVKDDVKAKLEDIKDNVKTKVGDAIDSAAPKVDEAAHKAKVEANEAAHRASIIAQEASHTAKVAAGEATYESEKKAENMAETLKRKLGL